MTAPDTFWIILHATYRGSADVFMVVPTLAMAKRVVQQETPGADLKWLCIVHEGHVARAGARVEQTVTPHGDIWTLWPAVLTDPSTDYVAV